MCQTFFSLLSATLPHPYVADGKFVCSVHDQKVGKQETLVVALKVMRGRMAPVFIAASSFCCWWKDKFSVFVVFTAWEMVIISGPGQ